MSNKNFGRRPKLPVIMRWPELSRFFGDKPARAEIVRQLRMMADSLEKKQYPDVMECKIAPGVDLDTQTIVHIELTLAICGQGNRKPDDL